MTPFLRAALAAAVVFAADQLSKWWVLDALNLRELKFMDVALFLNLVYARNTGVNFGLFASGSGLQQLVLVAFAVGVSLALLIWSWRTRDPRIGLGCGLLIGGALGNAFDRLREGAVIDFLNVDCCGIGNPYAFNIADAGIFLGAAAIAWSAWRSDPQAAASEAADRGGSQERG